MRVVQSYILKVLKEIHPDESISKKAMDIMDAFSADMFNRITLEAARLCRHTNKQTMTSREVETAVRLLLPGELGKHALSEGRKAVVQGLS
ncbi:hypothetical protein COCSUDRAFT_17575 [Coccomyxa subellipsoidea C-169]|uniref:Histone H2B n=1 Tax=Coccomyxa subellipsoidea (strain C-169) TaxID=574566 RepID=I0YT27_COCSC|nr:hypothetical protein COCSUDRAFT_17575 [Coccomyxa subellipsoidea C-169]EIE21546.1 hypothetical protein COCSUDRAFT_17575 [Coccomyxa subellipsoidea C-169]|eukprot:XP_005646090.1 hypothetical protein COCSUDRAFT_17575 [Coccomyxa subellipsoidea C-169]